MEQSYFIISMITAGAALATGLTSLFTGIYKDGERANLLFGIMALSIFLFLMLPPLGYIVKDSPPYTSDIKIKRIFIWLYYMLLPWFIEHYSGYKKRILSISVLALYAFAYVFMLSGWVYGRLPVWYYIVLLCFGLTLYYGLIASRRQIKSGKGKDGAWLLSSMSLFGLLYLLMLVDIFSNFIMGRLLGTNNFFPLHLHLLVFIVIMGLRLAANIFEKYRLEKVLRWRDIRWNSLMQEMHLLVIEFDKVGNIVYINPYAVKSLGWNSATELINKNWFDHFVQKDKIELRRNLFLESIRSEKILPYFTLQIQSKDDKELFINWTNVFVYDDSLQLKGILTIGIDITEQQKALQQVQLLKTELEKENLFLKGEHVAVNVETDIIGESEAIIYAIYKAKQVASTNATVLLEGETGVGKELFADLIHKQSYRSDKPFIKINCAALPQELIESELFGHEKGAFTGALQARKGRFELANGGTIFLDEIGELPLPLQPKLLRILQNGEFERIGGQQTIKVDVRIISATNRDLSKEVKAQRFREDLFYRLHVFPITIPPLRNRRDDIPPLVTHLVKKFAEKHQKKIENISKADLIRLTEYGWPGNIRELINVIERSIIATKGNTFKLDWMNENGNVEKDSPESLSMEEIERAHLLRVLKKCNWKINGPEGAALQLGLNPNTLRSRMKKLNITRNEE